MIVIDASAVLEIILATPTGLEVHDAMLVVGDEFGVPELLDLEVMQTLRRFLHRGELGQARASQALSILEDLRLVRHSHQPYLRGIWARRHNHTAYDAAYLSLAEGWGAPLWTCDAKFVRTPSQRVEIRLF
ncbi:MAG: type II toxin-antitoxin system VapC family toxin [Litorimonas sp.]